MSDRIVALVVLSTCDCKAGQLIPGGVALPEYFEFERSAAARYCQLDRKHPDGGWAVHFNGFHVIGGTIDRKQFGVSIS
jgi:hypothetical protein